MVDRGGDLWPFVLLSLFSRTFESIVSIYGVCFRLVLFSYGLQVMKKKDCMASGSFRRIMGCVAFFLFFSFPPLGTGIGSFPFPSFFFFFYKPLWCGCFIWL